MAGRAPDFAADFWRRSVGYPTHASTLLQEEDFSPVLRIFFILLILLMLAIELLLIQASLVMLTLQPSLVDCNSVTLSLYLLHRRRTSATGFGMLLPLACCQTCHSIGMDRTALQRATWRKVCRIAKRMGLKTGVANQQMIQSSSES